MNRFFVSIITVLLICNAGTVGADSAGLLWKLSGKQADVYLLGVLPFSTNDMYPVPESIESAYSNSRRMLVYVDLLSLAPFEAARTGTELAKAPEGKTMQDLLTDETWSRVDTITRQHGIPQGSFINQEPWFFAWSLGWYINAVNGYEEGKGMDRHLLERARSDENMEVIAVKSYAEWLGELDSLNRKEHELVLKAALDRIDAAGHYPASLVDAWMQGDAESIASLQSASLERVPSARDLLQRILEKRNTNLLERLERAQNNGDGDIFILVRAEQVVGDNGLPILLQKAGYQVERP